MHRLGVVGLDAAAVGIGVAQVVAGDRQAVLRGEPEQVARPPPRPWARLGRWRTAHPQVVVGVR